MEDGKAWMFLRVTAFEWGIVTAVALGAFSLALLASL